jgi:hypothetical protein
MLISAINNATGKYEPFERRHYLCRCSAIFKKNVRNSKGEIIMKLIVNAMISLIIIAIGCNAQQIFQPLPKPPGKYEAFASLREHPSSLDQFIRMSDLVIDGKITEVPPAVHLDPKDPTTIETHSHVSINDIIMGDLPKGQQSLDISEAGGKSSDGYEVVYRNYPQVKSGERYILFLKKYPVKEGNMNNKFLYYIVGWTGKFLVDDTEIIKSHPSSPMLRSSDALYVEKFIAAIKKQIDITNHPYQFPPGLPKPYPPDAPRFPIGQPKP